MTVVLDSSCRGQRISTNSLPRGLHLNLQNPPGEAYRHSSALAGASHTPEATVESETRSHLTPAGSVTGWGGGEAAGRSRPHLLHQQEAPEQS